MMTTRRTFLGSVSAAGGGLMLGLVLPGFVAAAPPEYPSFEPNAFIRIDPDGSVTLVMAKAEMGQGIFTALAQLLAEELEVSLDRVRLAQAPADDNRYGDRLFGGLQMTGGSTSIRSCWQPMRQAGATTRQLLITAAAQRWNVDESRLVARDGYVVDTRTQRRASYGSLAGLAARQTPRVDAPLKPASAFRLIGQPVSRLDSRSKVDGTARFGLDVTLPGLQIARFAACPVFGGSLAGFDKAAAMGIQGVSQVIALADMVAVVADNTWSAAQGLMAANPTWNDGPAQAVGMPTLVADLVAASQRPGAIATRTGDPSTALAGCASRVSATYQAPFLAHATMEPVNCTVWIRDGEVDVWTGTQVPTRAQASAARVAGLAVEQVRVHNQMLGGGFGRRLEVDYVERAVRIAIEVKGPVKVVWSREDDMRLDMYRPYYFDSLEAGLDAQGLPVSWTHRVAGSSIIARFFPSLLLNGVDGDAVEGARDLPYRIDNLHVDYARVEPGPIPTAFWRGVGPTHNCFVVESFMDELAHSTGADPLNFRRALMRDERARRVLDLVAAKASWGTAPATVHGTRSGRGISLLHAFGSYVAQVVQIAVDSDGTVRVIQVDCAIDCGVAVNPSSIAAQIEGGIVFGLSAALWGEITITNGRVDQSNFHDYRLMRLNEAPRIAVHIVPSTEAPGGVGEPGTSAVIPALTNAIYEATGRRIRTLPIGQQLAKAA